MNLDKINFPFFTKNKSCPLYLSKKALIFAYEDDGFNRPKELNFLKEKYPDSVELVGYKCGKGHNTAHNDCGLSKTKKIIKNYFENSNK